MYAIHTNCQVSWLKLHEKIPVLGTGDKLGVKTTFAGDPRSVLSTHFRWLTISYRGPDTLFLPLKAFAFMCTSLHTNNFKKIFLKIHALIVVNLTKLC